MKIIKKKIKQIIIMTTLLITNLQQKILASNIESSQLVQGTTRLTQDAMNTLRKYSAYLASALLVILFIMRMAGDANDVSKRDKQIKWVIICFILILVATSIIQVIASYYQ